MLACGGARSPLMIYTGRANGAAYIETIEDALPMFIGNAFDTGNNNWVYMHDSAPPYTSKYSMKRFIDNNINFLKWPANSPDLSPIQNICVTILEFIFPPNPPLLPLIYWVDAKVSADFFSFLCFKFLLKQNTINQQRIYHCYL